MRGQHVLCRECPIQGLYIDEHGKIDLTRSGELAYTIDGTMTPLTKRSTKRKRETTKPTKKRQRKTEDPDDDLDGFVASDSEEEVILDDDEDFVIEEEDADEDEDDEKYSDSSASDDDTEELIRELKERESTVKNIAEANKRSKQNQRVLRMIMSRMDQVLADFKDVVKPQFPHAKFIEMSEVDIDVDGLVPRCEFTLTCASMTQNQVVNVQLDCCKAMGDLVCQESNDRAQTISILIKNILKNYWRVTDMTFLVLKRIGNEIKQGKLGKKIQFRIANNDISLILLKRYQVNIKITNKDPLDYFYKFASVPFQCAELVTAVRRAAE